MKTVMLDTNIYGWAIARIINGNKKKEAVYSALLVKKLADAKDNKKIGVVSSQQIFDEIRRDKVRKIYPEVKELHDSLIIGIVEAKPVVRKLADEYWKKCGKKKIIDVSYVDFLIMASCSISRTHYFVTENRKHLNRKEIQEIIRDVNNKKGIFVPEIIDSEKALKLLF